MNNNYNFKFPINTDVLQQQSKENKNLNVQPDVQ